jgi:hypothetical protein
MQPTGSSARAAMPSLAKILHRDWIALGMLILIIAWWIALAAIQYWLVRGSQLSSEDTAILRILQAMGVTITLIGGGIALYRIRTIRRTFARGRIVAGYVVEIGENVERIRYAIVGYEIAGHAYRVRSVIEGTQAANVQQGGRVDVVVDPEKPGRGIVRELYV